MELAIQAYKDAMPDLCGYESIRDFIACTTHGMLIGVIDPMRAAKFLYAAQVAIGAFRLQPGEQSGSKSRKGPAILEAPGQPAA